MGLHTSWSDFNVSEIFVSKKREIIDLGKYLATDLEANLWIQWLGNISVHENYIVDWLDWDKFDTATKTIFSEAPVDDIVSSEVFVNKTSGKRQIVIESKPGQFDDRLEAVKSNLRLQTGKEHNVRVKKVITFDGHVSQVDLEKIKKYIINPNEKQESNLDDKKMERAIQEPKNHIILDGFIEIEDDTGLQEFIKTHSLSLNVDDIRMVYEYFRDEEKRNPTKVEIMLIETYWSDHCRHTTFLTEITDVEFTGEPSAIQNDIIKTHNKFKKDSEKKWKGGNTLMESATASARFLKDDPQFKGTEFLDISEEDNAASYKTQIELEDGTTEDWIIMFKNETHNSPTEAEPFGWAATCLWGAIRDTLSGRSFTFWAMRVSGSKDPTEPVSETMAWKLSQRAISIGAMLGYSSYGNQIGLATGRVREYFHPWYAAKRFECGYVVAAVKEENLVRERPKAWDRVIVFGWPVGRDGVWWATTSSKVSWDVDHEQLWAHVQKWNPVEERKMQRLMLNPEFTRKVIKSNDFGAGWVSVALWEIAEWIDIDLNEVASHVKYDWLSDEELVIAESQERMAIVVSEENYEAVMEMIRKENIHAFHAGTVLTDEENTENNRLKISYKWEDTVNLSRDFLNKNGATRKTKATVHTKWDLGFFNIPTHIAERNFDWASWAEILKDHLSRLAHASQKWLGWNFDNSVGASTILAPYGWKYQNSPQVAMVQKIPTFDWLDSVTWVASTFAFNPELLFENTYMWGMYAILETISKIVAVGWDYEKTWVSLQEYFGKLTDDKKWWEVYAGLLGTLKALTELKVAAIGWKDSMSGTHISEDGDRLDVPPTIVSFANCPLKTDNVVSAEFKEPWNSILHFPIPKWEWNIPDFEAYKIILKTIQKLISEWKVKSSGVVEQSWVYGAISNMMLWNKIWVSIDAHNDIFFAPMLGDIILEVSSDIVEAEWFSQYKIWTTQESKCLTWSRKFYDWTHNEVEGILITDIEESLNGTLEWVFPSENKDIDLDHSWQNYVKFHADRVSMETKEALKQKPKAIIPVFPWTNSELDTKHALIKAGFEVEEFVFYTNGTPEQFTESRRVFADILDSQDLIVFPGWFSNGDEPDGSAKYIANIMRSPEIREAFQGFIDRKGTITMWICNGFQALVKLWLFEESKIKDYLTQDDETLTFNTNMRHQTELVGMEVRSVLSPVLSRVNHGDHFTVPISNGEGRLIMPDKRFDQYTEAGQIPLVYIDENGRTTNKYNGSRGWAAALTSPDGRIFGLMPHPERTWLNVFKNVPWEKYLPVFEGVRDSIVGNK